MSKEGAAGEYRCGRMGFPLAALKLRLKRFCEVACRAELTWPTFDLNTHFSFSDSDAKQSSGSFCIGWRNRPSAVVQRLLGNTGKGGNDTSRRAAVSIERKISTKI